MNETTISYNEFLFYNLTQHIPNNKHPLSNLEYDLAFSMISNYYNEFFISN